MSDQLSLDIDLDYDDRVRSLALEIAIVLAPRLAPGTTRESATLLAERVALLSWERLKYAREPEEPVRCHTCDEMTLPKTRARVAVCPRCALEGRSAGARG